MSTPTQNEQHSKGITAISVEGYKSLAEACEIKIRPLTLLAGANSSGKSSLMQPLLLLKQTLQATYDPGALLLSGPNVRLTSTGQILSKVYGRNPAKKFTVGIQVGDFWIYDEFTKKTSLQGFELTKMLCGAGEGFLEFKPKMNKEQILRNLPIEFKHMENRLHGHLGEKREWQLERNRCFFQISLKVITSESGSVERASSSPSLVSTSPAQLFLKYIIRMIHVPGLRGNPERTYQATGVGHEYPGTFDTYVASVINYWQTTKDERLSQLKHNLEKLGLTGDIRAKQIDDTQVELRVGRLQRGSDNQPEDSVSIADVGFGVSQTLPVLVALLTAEPGQLVYIEQPEIHLHPRAQVALAEVLVAAANRGVRVVAETHSNLLLLAVQTLVAQGKITPEDVMLHWFARDDDGITKITSAELDQNGAFGDWPEDFDDVILNAEDKFLTAVETRLAVD